MQPFVVFEGNFAGTWCCMQFISATVGNGKIGEGYMAFSFISIARQEKKQKDISHRETW